MNEEKKGEEELLDFEFDELPDEGAGEAESTPAPEDEVIELTDIVEGGEEARSVKDASLDEIEGWLGEEEPVEEEEPTEGTISISEERVEAIITRVVGDVVERVARETMARVAEKVIKEAIDDLRQSLELPAE